MDAFHQHNTTKAQFTNGLLGKSEPLSAAVHPPAYQICLLIRRSQREYCTEINWQEIGSGFRK